MLCCLRSKPKKPSTCDWIGEMNIPSPTSSSGVLNPYDDFPREHKRIKAIGIGSEGVVEEWSHRATGHTIAVKIIKPTKKLGKRALPNEVEILRSLPYHKNILQCHAFYAGQPTPKRDCMLFEYCFDGDIFKIRDENQKKKKIFSESFLWTLFNQLADALAFLHEGIGCPNERDSDFWRPIVHRDIKPENIFVLTLGGKQDWSDIRIKLGDFGLSKFYDPQNEVLKQFWGTPCFWPPEQTWEGRRATPAGDMWAIGCVIHELAHGFLPIEDPKVTEERATREGNAPLQIEMWNEATKTAYLEAKAPRRPLPVNLEPHLHERDQRRQTTMKYSDALNATLMMVLNLREDERVTAGIFKEHIDEAHGTHIFEEMRAGHEAEVQTWKGESNSDEDWTWNIRA